MNSTLSTDEAKEIADGLGKCYLYESATCEGIGVYREENGFPHRFDPLSDADSMKVLKALQKLVEQKRYQMEIGEEFYIWEFQSTSKFAVFFNDEFNNESICRAYLAVLGEG